MLAAFSFLTRIAVPGASTFDAEDVARSAAWFPLVGILLGGVNSLLAVLLKDHLPVGVVAALLVLADVLLTGALHFDGLADTADGFGGGRNKEDILRIMRDHAIGSYGGSALVLIIALKLTAYSALLSQSNCILALVMTPALGRWSILLLAANIPYARLTESVVQGIGKRSFFWGTGLIVLSLLIAMSVRACVAAAGVIVTSAAFGYYCKRRIQGITGDTLGANLLLCEAASLLTFLWIW